MKKVVLFISSLILLCLLFVTPSFAARYTNQPVTIPISGGWVIEDGAEEYENFSGDAYLTINEVEIEAYNVGGGSKDIDVYMDGVISHANSAFYFKIHCYDANGVYLDTILRYFYFTEQYFTDHYVCAVTVPETTAMVEFEAYSPGAWTNTYFYTRYINVCADDGRVVGINDLLEPNYEAVGWHGRERLYALDGREILVAYNEIPAYKAVGWYDREDYEMVEFRQLCDTCFAAYDYESILDRSNYLLSWIERSDYREEISNKRASAMVCWSAVAGGAPLVMGTNNIYYDEENRRYIFGACLYNVSLYQPVVAFKMEFSCRDIFGGIVKNTSVYYSDSENIAPGDFEFIEWTLGTQAVDHIEDFNMNQVVFGDRTSWRR